MDKPSVTLPNFEEVASQIARALLDANGRAQSVSDLQGALGGEVSLRLLTNVLKQLQTGDKPWVSSEERLGGVMYYTVNAGAGKGGDKRKLLKKRMDEGEPVLSLAALQTLSVAYGGPRELAPDADSIQGYLPTSLFFRPLPQLDEEKSTMILALAILHLLDSQTTGVRLEELNRILGQGITLEDNSGKTSTTPLPLNGVEIRKGERVRSLRAILEELEQKGVIECVSGKTETVKYQITKLGIESLRQRELNYIKKQRYGPLHISPATIVAPDNQAGIGVDSVAGASSITEIESDGPSI